MNDRVYQWILALHVLGFITWIGTMFATSVVLRLHGRAAEAARTGFAEVEKALARWMERGALVAIACGVILLVGAPGPSMIKQPFMHIKLTLVVVLIGLHGLVRAKMARLGRGKGKPPFAALPPLILIVAGAIAAVIIVKPFVS